MNCKQCDMYRGSMLVRCEHGEMPRRGGCILWGEKKVKRAGKKPVLIV